MSLLPVYFLSTPVMSSGLCILSKYTYEEPRSLYTFKVYLRLTLISVYFQSILAKHLLIYALIKCIYEGLVYIYTRMSTLVPRSVLCILSKYTCEEPWYLYTFKVHWRRTLISVYFQSILAKHPDICILSKCTGEAPWSLYTFKVHWRSTSSYMHS